MSNLVRLLKIPTSGDSDSEGRRLGEDWVLIDLGVDIENTTEYQYYITTDGVHASELPEYPWLTEPSVLGELLVDFLNCLEVSECEEDEGNKDKEGSEEG